MACTGSGERDFVSVEGKNLSVKSQVFVSSVKWTVHCHLNDANYLSRIFTAAAQISTFLVLKSFKIFHDKKYFSFSVWSRWEDTLEG